MAFFWNKIWDIFGLLGVLFGVSACCGTYLSFRTVRASLQFAISYGNIPRAFHDYDFWRRLNDSLGGVTQRSKQSSPIWQLIASVLSAIVSAVTSPFHGLHLCKGSYDLVLFGFLFFVMSSGLLASLFGFSAGVRDYFMPIRAVIVQEMVWSNNEKPRMLP